MKTLSRFDTSHLSEDDESSNTSANESDSDISDKLTSNNNTGWAHSMAQVLKTTKPKHKKSIVLSRAKKHVDEIDPVKKEYEFQIDGKDTDVKPEKESLLNDLAVKTINRKLKIDVISTLRVKPSILERERDKDIKKIATKGVVQLFNAVKTQQKSLKRQLNEAGQLDSKRDSVLGNINKKSFLNVLMGGKRAKSEQVDNIVKSEMKNEDDNNSENESKWSVLKDDFMLGNNASHWDQNSDSESENNLDDDDTDDD